MRRDGVSERPVAAPAAADIFGAAESPAGLTMISLTFDTGAALGRPGACFAYPQEIPKDQPAHAEAEASAE